jgi:mono/diheme cytochrome c family protein
LKKALLFHQKCVSCHSQGKQPVQNTNKMKGGKHYEDRKNHSKIEGRGSGMPYGRGTGSKTVQEY